MGYGNFLMKVLCMIVLISALNLYQARASYKAAREEENAKAVAEVEAYNREIEKQMSDAESASPYADGDFEGEADGFGGPVRVKVTIAGGDIRDIEVLLSDGEDPAYFQQAQDVLEEILRTQGVEVEAVSGATFSSSGLINAVTEALRKAAS